jgi:Ca2+-dependent lipid-binding protein
MIGLDRTGLSDPYVRITLGNQTYRSCVMTQTNNPRWKETVIIKEINFYEKLESIIENPPEIILEVFDQDIYGVNEFMGKCYVKPLVNMNRVSPPKLKWYQLFHKVILSKMTLVIIIKL